METPMKLIRLTNEGSGLVTYVREDAPDWLRVLLIQCEVAPLATPPRTFWAWLKFRSTYPRIRRCWCIGRDGGILFNAGLQQPYTWALDPTMYYGEWYEA